MSRLIILLWLTHLSGYSQDWVLEKDQNGIKVYTRAEIGTNVKAFKATMSVTNSYEEIYKILKDYDHLSEWMANINSAKWIRSENGNDIVHYTLGVPWPFENRDMVLEIEVKEVNSITKVHQLRNRAEIQKSDEYIRMNLAEGSWAFKNLGGKTEIEYTFLGDPEGNMPAWVVNMFIVDGPYKTLSNLKELLK